MRATQRHTLRSRHPRAGRPPLTAVCFDLDGVLIHTMPLHAKAWQEALATVGLRVSRRAIYEWEGESGIVTARRLLLRKGRRPSREAIAALLHDKERRFQRLARRVRTDRRLEACIRRLARQGIRLALVTGTSSREVRRVVSKRTLAAFAVVVTGDRVRHGKPHPEPYRTAMRRLRVRPDHTVVVENAPYGIRSARRARVRFVLAVTTSLPKAALHEAHLVVRSVGQLCTRLEQLV